MWWTKQQTFTVVGRPARAAVKRSVKLVTPRSSRGTCESKRTPFARLDLTPKEQMANLALAEVHGDMRGENEILRADVRALEQALRKANLFHNQQAAEIARLRTECDRWLSETYLLSKQLATQNRKLALQPDQPHRQLHNESASQSFGLPKIAEHCDSESAAFEPKNSLGGEDRRVA